MAAITINFAALRNPTLRNWVEKEFRDKLFGASGHTHDGVNSPALGASALSANAVETAKIKDANVTAAKLSADAQPLTVAIADPGASGAIPITKTGTCLLTSAAAETRTLAAPTYAGQVLTLACKAYVGDIVITATPAINQTGNNTITIGAAGDIIELVGIEVGAAKAWRVVVNDGCTLTTVA